MDKKIALITGGIRGIGDAISIEFLKSNNYFVIAADINTERNTQWLNDKKQAGFEDVDVIKCDVTDFDECQKTMNTLKEKYKRVDILVNNAGITRDATLKNMTKADWDAVMRTDLDSIFNITKPVLQLMLENSYGRIINISSVNGQKGQFGQTAYAAAKAGMHGFTKSLALETARKNITVNTVSPGYTATDMMNGISPEILEKIVKQIPIGRLGQATEIARVVAFLADEASGYITGTNMSINGGLYLS
jgi:acetoacetyl-CoA reductase